MEITKEQVLSDEKIIKIIREVNKIQENKDNLPAYFIERFDKLNCVNNSDNRELSLYFDSLRNICINNNCQIEKEKITEYSVHLLSRISNNFYEIICD